MEKVINKCVDMRQNLSASCIAFDIRKSFIIKNEEDLKKDISFIKDILQHNDSDFGRDHVRNMLMDWKHEIERDKQQIKQGKELIKKVYKGLKPVEEREPTF